MKIGIITFHWATNYGAVLQVYALKTFLVKQGYDVVVINYVPRSYEKKFFTCFYTKNPFRVITNLLEYFKEQEIKTFRSKHLKLTRKYPLLQELKIEPPECDVYICGSDQVWNPYFTAGGEGKTTLSYFLDFGSEKIKRIAYAVSFGCTEYPKEVERHVIPVLSKFTAISVREETGREIVRKMGFLDVSRVPDPTLLLSDKEYDSVCGSTICKHAEYNFFYIIQQKQYEILKIANYFRSQLAEDVISTLSFRNAIMGIEKWIQFIKNAKFIVTNSFHGVVFSVIYHKPFIAVLVEGTLSGMNDRIITLLESLGLQDRIMDCFDQEKINVLLSTTIDWTHVDENIQLLRREAGNFLISNIDNK